MREEYLHTFRLLYHYAPTDRYKVQIQYHDKPATIHWMSAKQFVSLQNAFWPNGFSTRQQSIVGIFDGDRFCYARFERHACEHACPSPLTVPESVEIDPELRDE